MGKWVQLLKEVAPLCHPRRRHLQPGHRALRPIAQPRDRGRRPLSRDDGDICSGARRSRDRGRHRRPGARAEWGCDHLAGFFHALHRDAIVSAAARHQLPLLGVDEFFARSGAVMSYSVDLVQVHAQAASYIDRILRGAKPADLPVQRPTKYSLIINLKTAKALGLTVPPAPLAFADDVIE